MQVSQEEPTAALSALHTYLLEACMQTAWQSFLQCPEVCCRSACALHSILGYAARSIPDVEEDEVLLARVLKGFANWLAPATSRVADDLPQQTEAGLVGHLQPAMAKSYQLDLCQGQKPATQHALVQSKQNRCMDLMSPYGGACACTAELTRQSIQATSSWTRRDRYVGEVPHQG